MNDYPLFDNRARRAERAPFCATLKGEDDEDRRVPKAVASEIVGYPFGMFVGLRKSLALRNWRRA